MVTTADRLPAHRRDAIRPDTADPDRRALGQAGNGPRMPAQPTTRDRDGDGRDGFEGGALPWRGVLEPLAGLDGGPRRLAPPPDLAIGVELVAESSHNAFQQWGPAPAGEEHLREDRPLYVILRPLKRGAKGTWIKGGLTWKAFQFPRAEYAPAQERALRLVWRQLQAEDSYPTDAWFGLHAFDSGRIWQLLADAQEAGVPLVAQGVLADVVLDAPVEVGLDVTAAPEGGLEVTPSLVPARRPAADDDAGPRPEPLRGVRAVGSIGFYRPVEEEDGTWTLHLIPAVSYTHLTLPTKRIV